MTHATHQVRSKRTLERLLSAAERLLSRNRLLEELTVSEITSEAGLSVGAFYARFENKASLLPSLQRRYGNGVDRYAPVYFDPRRWVGKDLRSRVRLFVRLSLRLYYRHQGLIRALAIDWRRWDEPRSEEVMAARAAFHACIAAVFLPVREEIGHTDAERAIQSALLFFGSTCRDVLLYSPPTHPHPVRLSEHELAEELARAFYLYLRNADPALP